MEEPMKHLGLMVVVCAALSIVGCVHRAHVMSRRVDGSFVLMSAPARIDRAFEELSTTAREICGELNYEMTDPIPADEYQGDVGGMVRVETASTRVQAGDRRRVRWGRRAYRAEVRCISPRS
jgi:hypothetical protein